MSEPATITAILDRLSLPEQDIERLTFCSGNKAAKVDEWTKTLKNIQAAQTCAQLYQAIPQINRLHVNEHERKAMLDVIFPIAYRCTQTLSRSYLNQPINLSDEAKKIVLISQSILNALVTGYLICLRSYCQDKKRKASQEAAQALFNSFQCLTVMQLRNHQLYSQTSKAIWRQASGLMAIAKHLEVNKVLVKSILNDVAPASAEHGFLRLVAFNCAKTNQITQVDMSHVFKAIESWVKAIQFTEEPSTFWLDLNGDMPPSFTKKYSPPNTPSVVHIDFYSLTQQLRQAQDTAQDIIMAGYEISVPPEINSSILAHLERSWSTHPERSSERKAKHNTAELIIGFQQCHTKLSGCNDFGDFLGEQSGPKNDASLPNLSSLMGSFFSEEEKADNPELRSIAPLKVKTINVSKEGYCFEWEEAYEVRIDAGDILLMREQAKRQWSLGIIRWVRKKKNHAVIGVETLSNKPKAIAAASHYKDGTGYSDFMRAFIISNTQGHHNVNNQINESLVTPNLIFKEKARIKLRDREQSHNTKATLGICSITTGKVKCFDLKKQAEQDSQSNINQRL